MEPTSPTSVAIAEQNVNESLGKASPREMPRAIHTNAIVDVYVEAGSPVHTSAHFPKEQEYEEDTGAKEAIANSIVRNEEEKKESLRQTKGSGFGSVSSPALNSGTKRYTHRDS